MATVETQRKSVRAQAKYVHSSARKARLVTDLIRGRSVPEARTVLAFSQRAVAKDVEKVLRSAVANAESRHDLHWNGDDLVVLTAYVDEGPTLKRFRPRARGRASAIHKRMCHITLELAPQVAAAAATRPAPAPAERRPKSRTTDPSHADKGESSASAVAERPPAKSVKETPQAVKKQPAPADVVEKPKASRRKKKTEGSE